MNLFEKYGGQQFWEIFLADFYKELPKNPVIRHHYRNKDMDHIRLTLLGLLEVILISYSHISEQAMEDSHNGLGINSEEFDEWISIFRQKLRDHSVSDEDILYIVDILNHYRPFIVKP